MTRQKKAATAALNFCDYLIPGFIVCCQDSITDQNQCLSLLRLVDSHASFSFPSPPVSRLIITTEFRRNPMKTVEEIQRAKIRYFMKLVNPSKEETLLSTNSPPPNQDSQDPWNTIRVQNNVSGRLVFKTPGLYKFKVSGTIGGGPETDLMEVLFPVREISDIPGTYLVEFKTKAGQGSGQLVLSRGAISGVDSTTKWSGVYAISNNRILAIVNVESQGLAPTVFGDDFTSFALSLKGTINNADPIKLSGSMQGFPERTIDVVLTKTDQPGRSSVLPKVPKALASKKGGKAKGPAGNKKNSKKR